jgi:hypothetical protein
MRIARRGPMPYKLARLRGLRSIITVLLVVWLAAYGASAPQASARHVILFSLDGARADAVQAAVPASLAGSGSVSWTAQTIMPSSTLPSHASMLSGVSPAIHRVTFNDWRAGRSHFKRTTILTEVTRAGGKAAALVHKPKLLMFMPPGSVAMAQHLLYPRYRQADVVDLAARYFVEHRPALLFVHVADPDAVGHSRGWMTAPYRRVVGEVPRLIERLLRAFETTGASAHALLIVTADHGGHWMTHGTARPEDMTIPWMALGGAARPGMVIRRPIATYDTAATVLAALGIPIPADWQGRPVEEALKHVVAPGSGGTDGNPRR